jgi:hypothetical protein
MGPHLDLALTPIAQKGLKGPLKALKNKNVTPIKVKLKPL